jgi:hypothetical protein
MITHERRKGQRNRRSWCTVRYNLPLFCKYCSNAKLGYACRSHFGRDLNEKFLEYSTEASEHHKDPLRCTKELALWNRIPPEKLVVI